MTPPTERRRPRSRGNTEVRLSVEGEPRIMELVVSVSPGEELEVAGAQARDTYGAAARDLGGHLDRRYRSRD